MVGLPTGTVTFLFTDIEGSTRLLTQLGSAYDEVLAEHEEILRSAFDAHDGRVVDTQGDSFFVAFPKAKEAVAAAAEAQRRLAAHDWTHGAEIKVRMGLHTGEPRVGDQRYVGIGVNKAARIGAAGHGGQVLLSSTTRELVEDELPAQVTLRDLGERRIKDFDQPERLFQLIIEGVPSDFGEPRTLDVELRRKRRRLYTSTALLALFAAAVAIAFVAFGQRSDGVADAGAADNSVVVIDPESNEVVASVPVGVKPSALAVGADSVWVANTGDQSVTRIDADSRRVVRTFSVGEYPSDIAVVSGSPWVALGGPQQLRRIAPQRPDADERLPALEVPEGAEEQNGICSRRGTSLAAGEDRLWLVCYESIGAYASRIDPRRGEVRQIEDALTSSSPVLPKFSDVTFGLGSAWLVDQAANAVTQIDASSLRQIRQVPVGKGPSAGAYGFGSVWVANTRDDSVSQFEISGLDPVVSETTTVVANQIPVGDAPVDVAVDEDAVWVANRGDRTVQRIDPTTGRVVATIQLDNVPVRLAAGAGAVWVTTRASE